ncbi:MAG: paraquat-inducible protein A [Methylococcus sp.]|nr:MAG: paraquat-inducible protein A [Methylococcus sp.]
MMSPLANKTPPPDAGSGTLLQEQAHSLLACPDCDLVFPLPCLSPGEKARCGRCGAVLMEPKSHGFDYSIALALTSLLLFVLSNTFPLLKLQIAGREQIGAIMTGVHALYDQGFWEIAFLVLLVTIIAPLFRIISVLYVLLPLWFGRRLLGAAHIFRWMEILRPWAMSEVFMLGILVAMVKLGDLATIQPGVALYSFAGLILFMAATDASLDDGAIWVRLEDGA